MQNKFSKKLLMFSLLALVATPATQAEPLQDTTIAFSSLFALLGVSYVGFRACSWTGGKISKKFNNWSTEREMNSILNKNERIRTQASENIEQRKLYEISQVNPLAKQEELYGQVNAYKETAEWETAINDEFNKLHKQEQARYRPKIKNKITKFFNALPIPKVTTINNILKYGAIAAALTTVVACINDASIRTVIHA